MAENILEMKNIIKEFPGVKALNDVNFSVKKGEIHALVGENGAGKSTLMKVLSGVHPFGSYEGDIIIGGEVKAFNGIKDSEESKVAIIYQELALVKEMNIVENIFLGNEIKKHGIINWNEAINKTKKVLAEVGLKDNPLSKIVNLGIGKQQLIEIAKAISKNIDILILDEPTAALTESESDNLLIIIKELRNKGVSCVYISHKLNEVIDVADTITVLRDGQTITSFANDETINEEKIISLMVGRELTTRFPRVEHTPGDVVLEVNNLNVYSEEITDKKIINNVSFKARKGEIVGISGLMGAGRTEMAMSLFGAYGSNVSGKVKLDGAEFKIKGPRESIEKGLCYLSEDRKANGLVLMMDIKENISLASLEKVCKNMMINSNEEMKVANEYVKKLLIKTPSIEQNVNNLSGGNQQKVVLAKWLLAGPKVLILDEPTRGIDVGAKFEIYNIMNELVKAGVSIIMISSELPEVLGMSDRILVMNNGEIKAELGYKDVSQEKVMHYATGGK